MKTCIYQSSTEDVYSENLILICFKNCCYFYPYIYIYIDFVMAKLFTIILRFFHVSSNFSFTTSQMMLNYYF